MREVPRRTVFDAETFSDNVAEELRAIDQSHVSDSHVGETFNGKRANNGALVIGFSVDRTLTESMLSLNKH